MKLSKESQDFLDDLHLYLFSSGKKDAEIEEITNELKDHLAEAEKKGKNVDDIIGQSPKDYMKQLANEMPTDYKGWIKYIPMIILGAFAYSVLGDAVGDGVAYSLWEIIGYPLMYLLLMIAIFGAFKYVASHKLARWKELLIYYLIGIFPIASFVVLLLLDREYGRTLVEFSTTGNLIAAILAMLAFIILALWSKTWVWVVVPVILFLPDIILKSVSLNKEIELLISGFVPLIGLLLYMFIYMQFHKKKKACANTN